MKYLALLACLLAATIKVSAGTIPLEHSNTGHLLISGELNGKSTKFILDTGATGTVLDLAKLKQFHVGETQTGSTGVKPGDETSGIVTSYPVNINSLSLGPYKSSVKSVFAQELGQIVSEGVVGIIGQDVLHEQSAWLRLSVPELLVNHLNIPTEKWTSEIVDDDMSSMVLSKTEIGLSLVEATYAGKSVKLIVDTGSLQTVLDSISVEELGIRLTAHPSAKTMDEKGNLTPMYEAADKDLLLGSCQNLGDRFLTTDFTAVINALGLGQEHPVIGVIGLQELAALQATLDVSNNVLSVTKNPN